MNLELEACSDYGNKDVDAFLLVYNAISISSGDFCATFGRSKVVNSVDCEWVNDPQS